MPDNKQNKPVSLRSRVSYLYKYTKVKKLSQGYSTNVIISLKYIVVRVPAFFELAKKVG